MSDIHKSCLEYGKDEDGYIDYVKGANIAAFVKVADAMLDKGLFKYYKMCLHKKSFSNNEKLFLYLLTKLLYSIYVTNFRFQLP